MLRKLYPRLPLHKITTHTNVSRTENGFVRKHGVRFAAFIRAQDAAVREPQGLRARSDRMLEMVRKWLHTKVWSDGNYFGWLGFAMKRDEISRVTFVAHAEWFEGYSS